MALPPRAKPQSGSDERPTPRPRQVYGGVVYMDFDRSTMKRAGHGLYTPLPPALLPRLWLIYADNPSDSGRVHSDVKRRWAEGDPEVREKMELVAACAEEGK
jgi:glucuronokinase